MGLISPMSRMGRTGDRLEEDGRPPGRGLAAAWKRIGAITEEAGFRPAVLQKAANRVHPQFRCIVLLYLLLSL